MDLQAIGLFKLIVMAGLAFFSYRKIKIIQDNNLAIRHQQYQPIIKDQTHSHLPHPKQHTQLSTSAVSARTLDLQDCRQHYQHMFAGSIYEEKSQIEEEKGQEGSQKGSCIEQIMEIEKQEQRGQLEVRSEIPQVEVDQEQQQEQQEVLRSKTERPRKRYDFRTFQVSHAKKASKPPKKKIFKSRLHE